LPPGDERYAVVEPGAEVQIVLPGTGWLYIGREYDGAPVELLGRERLSGDDTFTFRIPESGEQTLTFQQQDAVSGGLREALLHLDVAPSGDTGTVEYAALPDREPALMAAPAAGQENSVTDTRVAVLRASEPEGEAAPLVPDPPEISMDAFLAGNAPTADDAVVQRLTSRLGEYPEAVVRAFWRLVASSGSSFAPEARLWLFEDAVSRGDDDAVSEAVSLLDEAGELAQVASVGEPDDRDALFGSLSDRLVFEIANSAFAPGPDRDLGFAARAYGYIVDFLPLSGYWDASHDQLQYIDRHFFEVR
jgi:hypothetical protein